VSGLRTRLRSRDERGALTPAVIVMALGLLLLGGLVTDGGRQLNAKLQAQSTAEEAARAGATMLDLRQQEARIDKDTATDAVNAYCDVAKENDSRIDECGVDEFGRDENKEADWVSVRVTMKVPALLFGIIGVNELNVDVSAQASPVQAIAKPYQDANLNPIQPTADYPTITPNVSTTSGTAATSQPVPIDYTTFLCDLETVVPLTVGLSCMTSTIVLPSPPPPPPPPPPPSPPPPPTTITTTVFSTFPTNVPAYPTGVPSLTPPTTVPTP